MRRPAFFAILATIAMLFASPVARAASPTPNSYAARLLGLVNIARAQHGLRPLALVSGTTSVATTWTQHMAAARVLSHNPDLGPDLSNHGSTHWRMYGENVGMGSAEDPDGLFVAYWLSPEHRANILNSHYRYVGVAVEFTGSRAWNTFDFVDVYGTPPAPHVVQHRNDPVAVTKQAPPVRSTQRAARPAGPVVVHVEGLRHLARHPQKVATHPQKSVVAAPAAAPIVRHRPAPALSAGLVAHSVPISPRQGAPVALAAAIVALCFSARRWLLVTSRVRT